MDGKRTLYKLMIIFMEYGRQNIVGWYCVGFRVGFGSLVWLCPMVHEPTDTRRATIGPPDLWGDSHIPYALDTKGSSIQRHVVYSENFAFWSHSASDIHVHHQSIAYIFTKETTKLFVLKFRFGRHVFQLIILYN